MPDRDILPHIGRAHTSAPIVSVHGVCRTKGPLQGRRQRSASRGFLDYSEAESIWNARSTSSALALKCA